MDKEAIVGLVVAKLKRIREEKGITQRCLAEATPLSQAGIAHMELGDTTPTLYFLLTVAEALEVNLAEILSEALKADGK